MREWGKSSGRWLKDAALVLLALTAGVSSASAQQQMVRLDTASSEVRFSLGATMHTVHGVFRFKSGEISVDPLTGQASGAIVVDATSGNSENSGRDQKMHKEILESAKYGEIVFAPKKITAAPGQTVLAALRSQGMTQLQADGIFRLHGSEHETTIPITVENDGAGHVTITSAFPVPYIQWGLKNPSTFVLRVNSSVDIDLRVQGAIVAPAR